ncbi:hypothetical protein ASZ90_001388 [hydrocarbon metagenome]|uniref:Uncharacterized protein n=1 Tax=hydrocarbon metagenome TaxID=938273 RepID=A0A0W8G6V9_9ZZZZ
MTPPQPAGLGLAGTLAAPVLTWDAGADAGRAGQTSPAPADQGVLP